MAAKVSSSSLLRPSHTDKRSSSDLACRLVMMGIVIDASHAHQGKRGWDHEKRQQRCRHHPAQHRRSNAAHDLGARARSPDDGQQAGEDHGHRHRLRTHAQHCTLTDGVEHDLACDGHTGAHPVFQGVLEIQQHDDAELGRYARQRDEANAGGHGQVVAQQVEEPDSSGQRQRQRGHDEGSLLGAPERQVQQHEDDQERGRHHHLEPFVGPLHVFELARVGQAHAWLEPHLLGDLPPQIANHRGDVPSSHVDVDPARWAGVLALEHGWSVNEGHGCQSAERHLLASGREHRQIAQLLRRIAQLARIAQVDGEARQAFYRLADVLAAYRP
mmetsp:Transcript_53143/g.124421  ORF Transcript_53143/g.124421 Transcript_53143/m.124421 type:complete len:329 (-) Transcript_53143:88-1074(-)